MKNKIINCPNCGCNPQNEPYCMVATHCPKCGYIFKANYNDLTEGLIMNKERKEELLNNMKEYLENYGDIDFNSIGVTEETDLQEAYNNCLGYIVELVGNNGNKRFLEEVLGFTKEELVVLFMED